MPDEWQARQATSAILQVSSSKHNANKNTTRERGPFHQSNTAILTEEKREEKQFTKPTHVQSTCFGPRSNVCVHVCVCVCVKMKKRVPDEWQALQAKIANAMKRKVQKRKRPISSVESLSS